jgi:hypothetical protein
MRGPDSQKEQGQILSISKAIAVLSSHWRQKQGPIHCLSSKSS